MAQSPRVSPPPALYLIRHGQTAWSLSGQHTGVTDIPLTEEGQAQASRLAPWLAGLAFSAVFTSPRRRALQTCEGASLAARARLETDLAEWDYGAFEGLRSADILAKRPDWNIFRDGCPGGESPAAVGARADRLIDRLARGAGNIALFSHGQFSCVLAARWIGLPVLAAEHFALATASVSVLSVAPRHPGTRVISLWSAVPGALANPP